ncbi:element excision factor XisH family protein [Pannus brasiliensis CCIBt3594]|uniref:Element excision factor XisH family protein n=1 Tax=Pannus brasiliensis CCIBt3594 TaxID=1427578 RepID=A0AAW9QPZ8_9CHRO
MGSLGDRELYLAVSELTYSNVFTIELGQILLNNQIIKLMVFDEEREAIERWIPE